MQENSHAFERMTEIYTDGNVPWDDVLPPPEVMATVAKMQAGRALDVGCGYGRASIYMAQQGWRVEGIDFVPMAIDTAKERVQLAGVQVDLQVGDITNMPFTDGFDFVLDVGCGHGLIPAQWSAYHHELKRLVKPNGLFLLFARLQPPDNTDRPGVVETDLMRLFTDGFQLETMEKGLTKMSNEDQWQSAWLWFRRNS
jgi:SAM-dependent methyltransferase